jgi:hypothetical protein
MRMPPTTDETPEAIVMRLAPYAATFHECLREAIGRAREVFAPRDGTRPPFESWLFAHHVRWELKQLLHHRLPAGTPVAVEELTIMSSVVVHLDDIEIRVRKSEPGEVPPPGPSQRMQGWYAQTLDGSVAANVLLWHVDEELEYLGLDVAFPYGGTAAAPLVRWQVPLLEVAVAAPADDLEIALAEAGPVVARSETGEASP